MVTINNNHFVGKVLIKLESIDSTNNYAKELLAKSKPLDGTAIIAHSQTAGRGQIGNIWLSEPGKNVTVSVIVYPNFLKAAIQFLLTQAVALAIVDAVKALTTEDASIKWPNDIFLGEQKLAGILIENSVTGQMLIDSVVGIGLNVNQTVFSDLQRATSMALISGKDWDNELVLNHLLFNLEKRYLQLKQGHTQQLVNDYTQHLFRLNEWHTYETVNGNIEGKIIGVNSFGQLQMETSSGIASFNHREIGWVF